MEKQSENNSLFPLSLSISLSLYLSLSLSLSLSLVTMATPPDQTSEVHVVLIEQDIPGAALNYDRLETYCCCFKMVAVVSGGLCTHISEESSSDIKLSNGCTI